MTSAVEVIKDAIWPLTEWDGEESNALAASQAAISALEAAGFVVLDKQTATQQLRLWCRARFGPWITWRTAQSALRAMIQAARSTP